MERVSTFSITTKNHLQKVDQNASTESGAASIDSRIRQDAPIDALHDDQCRNSYNSVLDSHQSTDQQSGLRAPSSVVIQFLVRVEPLEGTTLQPRRFLFHRCSDAYCLSSTGLGRSAKASIKVEGYTSQERQLLAQVDFKFPKWARHCDAFIQNHSDWRCSLKEGRLIGISKLMDGFELLDLVRQAVKRSHSVELTDYLSMESEAAGVRNQVALTRIRCGIERGKQDQVSVLDRIRINRHRMMTFGSTVDTTRSYLEPALILAQNFLEVGREANSAECAHFSSEKGDQKEAPVGGLRYKSSSQETYTSIFDKQMKRVVEAIEDTRLLAQELGGKRGQQDSEMTDCEGKFTETRQPITQEIGNLQGSLKKHLLQSEVAPYFGLACMGMGAAALAGLHWVKGEQPEATVYSITSLAIAASLIYGVNGIVLARRELSRLEDRYGDYKDRLITNLDNASEGAVQMAGAINGLKHGYLEEVERLQVYPQMEALLLGFKHDLDHVVSNHYNFQIKR